MTDLARFYCLLTNLNIYFWGKKHQYQFSIFQSTECITFLEKRHCVTTVCIFKVLFQHSNWRIRISICQKWKVGIDFCYIGFQDSRGLFDFSLIICLHNNSACVVFDTCEWLQYTKLQTNIYLREGNRRKVRESLVVASDIYLCEPVIRCFWYFIFYIVYILITKITR